MSSIPYWQPRVRLSVIREQLVRKYDHRTDYGVRLYPSGSTRFYVRILQKGPQMVLDPSKLSLYDVDGTMNRPGTESPTILWLQYIFSRNRYIGDRSRRILQNVAGVERSENPAPFASAIEDDFRRGELSWRLHIDACRYAAENTSIAPGLKSCMRDLRRMGYVQSILSATPYELIKCLENRVPVYAEDSEGSDLRFGRDGLFKSMRLGVGESRVRKRDSILQRFSGTKFGLVVIVDDNPINGKKLLTSAVNPVFGNLFVGLTESRPLEGDVTINMMELREDYTKYPRLVEKFERAIASTSLMSQSEYRRCVVASKEAVAAGRASLAATGVEFEALKSRMLDKMEDFRSGIMGMFSFKNTGLDEYLRGIRYEDDPRIAKPLIDEFIEKFTKYSVEYQMPLQVFSGQD